MIGKIGIDSTDDLWIFKYLENLYVNSKSNTKLSLQTKEILRKNARDFNILYEDLEYRVGHGMSILDAIDLGRHESDTYGIKYYSKIDNSNFMNYLKYYIRTLK